MDGGFLAQLRDRIGLILATALTIAWVAVVGVYVNRLGASEVIRLPPTELALLIASAAGPLAALWLVVAAFDHRRDLGQLAHRLKEMSAQNRQSLQQAEAQTRVLMQLQTQIARAQGGEAYKLALHELAANAAVVAERLGVIPRDSVGAFWARYGAGDITAFPQSFLNFAARHPDIAERMAEAVARDPVARTALSTFVRRYEQMADSLSDDKMTRTILDESALGRGYRLFKEADALAAMPAALDDAKLADLAGRLDAAHPDARAPAE